MFVVGATRAVTRTAPYPFLSDQNVLDELCQSTTAKRTDPCEFVKRHYAYVDVSPEKILAHPSHILYTCYIDTPRKKEPDPQCRPYK